MYDINTISTPFAAVELQYHGYETTMSDEALNDLEDTVDALNLLIAADSAKLPELRRVVKSTGKRFIFGTQYPLWFLMCDQRKRENWRDVAIHRAHWFQGRIQY